MSLGQAPTAARPSTTPPAAAARPAVTPAVTPLLAAAMRPSAVAATPAGTTKPAAVPTRPAAATTNVVAANRAMPLPPRAAPATSQGPCAKPASQLDALLCVKSDVDPDNELPWSRSSGANNGYCSWKGIRCDSKYNVVQLNLGSSDLRGTMPHASALKALPELLDVKLNNNSISGVLPADYATLAGSKVRFIDASSNKLNGSLPAGECICTHAVACVAATALLTPQHLKIARAHPAEWGALKNLQKLTLFGNRLSGPLPNSWSSMAGMRDLDLGGTIFRYCDAGNLLQGTLPKVYVPATWQQHACTKAHVTLTTCMHAVIHMPLQDWVAMRNLTRLEVSCNRLTGSIPAEYGKLDKLKGFYAGANKLSGTLPAALANAKELNDVLLFENQLQGTLPSEWKALTKMSLLSLGQNNLTGTLPPEWSSMKELKIFNAESNKLTGA